MGKRNEILIAFRKNRSVMHGLFDINETEKRKNGKTGRLRHFFSAATDLLDGCVIVDWTAPRKSPQNAFPRKIS
jgi:hypothetical protein